MDEAPEPTLNPYDYKIFEYNTSKDDEAWGNFFHEVNSFEVDTLVDLQPEGQLRAMYQFLEAKAEEFLEKYSKNRFNEERRALDKMDEDPSYFYKYVRRFCKNDSIYLGFE